MALASPPAVMVLVAIAGAVLPAQPLPDQDTFFAEVRKRLAGNDLIMSRFSYRERSTELKLNPFGRMGTGPVRVYEVYPHPNDDLTYRRLVERDGRRLTLAEIEEQDREYRETLSDWQRRVAREGQSEREARLRKAQEARERDQEQAREAIDMFDFSITGRDTWEGQPAIVIAFQPRKDARPRSREGRVARAFAGRALVHETEYEVMHVEATALDDVSFGWGMIARLHKGSEVRFTRRKTAGAWLPAETRFEGTGRALLLRKVTIHFRRTYDAYRSFDPSELPARLGWER